MKDLIQAHKKLIKSVKEQMGFSDYGMLLVSFPGRWFNYMAAG